MQHAAHPGEILLVQRLVEPQLAPQRLDRLSVGIALEHLDDHVPRAHMHQHEDQDRDQK